MTKLLLNTFYIKLIANSCFICFGISIILSKAIIMAGIFSEKIKYYKALSIKETLKKDCGSMERLTMNLKVRLKSTKKGIFQEGDLVEDEDLATEIDNIVNQKKDFLKALKSKRSNNPDEWLKIFTKNKDGEESELIKVLKKIYKLELDNKNFYQDVGKLKSGKFKEQDIYKCFESCTKLNIIRDFKFEDFSIGSKLEALINKLELEYRLKRGVLYKKKATLKNEFILSDGFLKWSKAVEKAKSIKLKTSLKRDILNLFVQTELQVVANFLNLSSRIDEIVSVTKKNPTTRDYAHPVFDYATQLLNPSFKKLFSDFGYETNPLEEITRLKYRLKSYALPEYMKAWGNIDNPDIDDVYKLHLELRLEKDLKDFEDKFRHNFSSLRNLVGEQIKRIMLLNCLRDILQPKNPNNIHYAKDVCPSKEVYNQLRKSVRNSLIQYLNNEKSFTLETVKKLHSNFDILYNPDVNKYNALKFKDFQNLVLLNFFVFETKIEHSFFDRDKIKFDYAGYLWSFNDKYLEGFTKSNDKLIDKLCNLYKGEMPNLQCYSFKNKQIEAIKNFPTIPGISRIAIKDSLNELIENQESRVTKEEFEKRLNTRLEAIENKLDNFKKNNYLKKVGTQFQPLIDKIPIEFKDVRSDIEKCFEGFVNRNNGMINYQENRTQMETDFGSKIAELKKEMKVQITVDDKDRNLLCYYKYRFLINFWITIKYNIPRDKDRKGLEDDIASILSLTSYYNQTNVQQVYLADLLKTADQEGKDGEIWVASIDNKLKIFAAIRRDKESKITIDQGDLQKYNFYSLKYKSNKSLSRKDLDIKFQDIKYSQWEDFNQMELTKITDFSPFILYELQTGTHQIKKFIHGYDKNNPTKLFKNVAQLTKDLSEAKLKTILCKNTDKNIQSVITGIKLVKDNGKVIEEIDKEIDPNKESSSKNKSIPNIYIRLTILNLFTAEAIERDPVANLVREGRDLGDNIFVTAGSINNDLKVQNIYNPFNQQTKFYKEYHNKILASIYEKGYAPMADRSLYRSKKKWIVENLVAEQQKRAITTQVSGLYSKYIYEDNLEGKSNIVIKTQADKSTGIAEKNDILQSTKLFDPNRIRKLFESGLNKITFNGKHKNNSKKSHIKILKNPNITGVGVIKTENSSTICVNCGARNNDKNNKGFRVLAGNGTEFRTRGLHNNSEVAECGNCGFKTLCDYQAGLNLAIFDYFTEQLLKESLKKEEKDRKEITSDDLQAAYKNHIKNFKPAQKPAQKDKPIIKYNDIIGIKGSILEDISEELIKIQKPCGKDKEIYKVKLREINAWKTGTPAKPNGEFSQLGFIQHIILTKYKKDKKFADHILANIGLNSQDPKVGKSYNHKIVKYLEAQFQELDKQAFKPTYNPDKLNSSKIKYEQKYTPTFMSVYNSLKRELDKVLSMEAPKGSDLTQKWLTDKINKTESQKNRVCK